MKKVNKGFSFLSHLQFFLKGLVVLISPQQIPFSFFSRGSCLIVTLFLSSYGRAKQRYARGRDDEKLSPGLHLASAAEAGALVSITDTIKSSFLLRFFRSQSQAYDAFRSVYAQIRFGL